MKGKTIAGENSNHHTIKSRKYHDFYYNTNLKITSGKMQKTWSVLPVPFLPAPEVEDSYRAQIPMIYVSSGLILPWQSWDQFGVLDDKTEKLKVQIISLLDVSFGKTRMNKETGQDLNMCDPYGVSSCLLFLCFWFTIKFKIDLSCSVEP